jgi:hypothetical protein
MLRLIDLHLVPSGGYFFDEIFERDGRKYRKHFNSHPEAGTQAARIAVFRKANGLARADIMDALEDLEQFTVARLPVGNRWVYNTETPWSHLVSAAYGPGCRTCGGTSPK